LTDVNYKQLSPIHVGYEAKGLSILCFPCNQFGKQEPGTDEEIKKFIAGYQFGGDVFSKINVNGKDAAPLYKFLKKQKGGILGSFIKWNFTKFLVDCDGNVTQRFGPTTKPNDILPQIDALLAKEAKPKKTAGEESEEKKDEAKAE
jgi:glutathione peroxidase